MAEQSRNEIETFILSLPDAEAARVFLQRLESEHPERAARCHRHSILLLRLLTIAAYSPFLAENLLRYPDDIDWFERENERGMDYVKTTEQMAEDLSRLATRMYTAEPRALLLRFRNRELLRIYLRDCLGLATLAEVTEELSNLADVIIGYALKLAIQEATNKHGAPQARDERGRISPSQFAVIALGKLGCRELNYASDIDLMFLYCGAGETAGDGLRRDSVITNKEFFTQVAQRIIKTISGLATDSAVYRVDLRLRPYGRDGDMVWEVERAADYYREKAENWERQMLIRARASAGEEIVFTRFFDLVRDVVFSESHPQALAEVRRAKEKIDRKMAKQSGGFNVKLGIGGIREIEFIAQALQLAHGGREPWLRAAQTLISLARLAEKGLVSEQERTALSSAYRFFRTVEHRLQMEHGAQTHTLPLAPDRLQLVARRCGYRHADAATQFRHDLGMQSATVRAIYNRIFAKSAESTIDIADEPDEERQPLYEEVSQTEDKTQSAAANVAIPSVEDFDEETTRLLDQAAMAIHKLLELTSDTKRAPATGAHSSIIHALAKERKVAINPTRSLKNLILWAESFATYKDKPSHAIRQYISDHPDAIIQTLLMLLSSQYLASILLSRPFLIAASQDSNLPQTTDDFARRLRAAVNHADNPTAKADALRRAWNEVIVGIGYRDMRGVWSLEPGVENQGQQSAWQVDEHLRASNLEQTGLAEATLQIAVDITLESFGVNQPLPFAVLGLGRLGHAGMDYGSDLDLLIVYDDSAAWNEACTAEKRYGTAAEFYADFTARLLQKLSALTREGFLYRVDLRLRPEGKNGLLAQGIERLLLYLRERASTWEHSAYLKAREVAGDLSLGAKARQAIIETIFTAAAQKDELKRELATMRKRLETEKARSNSRDIKWGEGGMTDVYFITRYLQLRDHIAFPTEAGTLALIQHLGTSGAISDAAAHTLFNGYSFLRRLDHRMRLWLDRPTSTLPVSPMSLADLSRSMGFASVEEFEERYARHTSAIRAVYKELFS